jgi:sugar (pentulose or hexulose) kinase
VKVILFSQTGERATPIVRQAAKDYWNFASLSHVLWREEDASFWWNAYVTALSKSVYLH